MPYKKPKIEKIFYSIGEEGTRLFTKEDVETAKLIHHLVKERGMTIKGAQQKLKDNREETIHNFEIVQRLQDVRKQLVEIRDEMQD